MSPLPREWLRKAEEDFQVAASLLRRKRIPANTVLFHSQQAAEKYLKALLQDRDIRFGRTHDLEELLKNLGQEAGPLALLVDDLRELTRGAVHCRYPGFDATTAQAREAVAAARRVRTAVLGMMA